MNSKLQKVPFWLAGVVILGTLAVGFQGRRVSHLKETYSASAYNDLRSRCRLSPSDASNEAIFAGIWFGTETSKDGAFYKTEFDRFGYYSERMARWSKIFKPALISFGVLLLCQTVFAIVGLCWILYQRIRNGRAFPWSAWSLISLNLLLPVGSILFLSHAFSDSNNAASTAAMETEGELRGVAQRLVAITNDCYRFNLEASWDTVAAQRRLENIRLNAGELKKMAERFTKKRKAGFFEFDDGGAYDQLGKICDQFIDFTEIASNYEARGKNQSVQYGKAIARFEFAADNLATLVAEKNIFFGEKYSPFADLLDDNAKSSYVKLRGRSSYSVFLHPGRTLNDRFDQDQKISMEYWARKRAAGV